MQPRMGSPETVFDYLSRISFFLMFVSLLGENEISHDKPSSAYLRLRCVRRIALSMYVKINRLLPLV